MTRRKLVCIAEDDGSFIELTIDRYIDLGSTQIGPIEVYRGNAMSLPVPVLEDWMRDMAVLFRETL